MALYASGHGFGHAARVAALAAALRQRAGVELRIRVRSDAPAWIVQEADPRAVVSRACLDPGIRQRNALDVDLAATAEAHRRHLACWEESCAREATWLRSHGVVLVVADVAPLACEAAARAGVPSFVVSNFTWDWVLEPWLRAAPVLETVVQRYREAYARAEALFRLPLHGEFPAFRRIVDVPHVVRHACLPPAQVRRELGLAGDDARALVLVSFGGFSRTTLAGARQGDAADLRPFVFAGFGPAPAGLNGDWRELAHPSAVPHPDLVAAADVVIGKAGYSTAAEVLAHRARFLFVPRDDYREARVLADGLQRDGCARPLSREDFFAGRWRAPLTAMLRTRRPATAPRSDGAELVADALLARL